MKNLKKLTLLHSNDLHGDFTSRTIDEKLIGGISMLSGYVQSVRREADNVLYAIAGDMFRGSVIDSEYLGISTIEIMNMLGPDVATIGNHEVDYGLAHLLFVEKCANFPLINANMYLTTNGVRLFPDHWIAKIDGMRVLFIGGVTEEVLAMARKEKIIGNIIEVRDIAREAERVINAFQTEDIDLTVLLTHIGFEEDKKLAAQLDPSLGIDIIIGGHSHTLIEEPVVVNGIPIVQAAVGTAQIGRFDLLIDVEADKIESFTWQLVPIDAEHCERDPELEAVVCGYKDETDKLYSRVIGHLDSVYEHPSRNRESAVGRIFADAFRKQLGLDIMMVASGSLRAPEIGPVITYHDLVQMFPFDDSVWRFVLTGAQLKHGIRHLFRKEALEGIHTEFYQFSAGIHFEMNPKTGEVSEITWRGNAIPDTKRFRIGMNTYHFLNMERFLDIPKEEMRANAEPKIVSTNSLDVLEAYFSGKNVIEDTGNERWVTIE